MEIILLTKLLRKTYQILFQSQVLKTELNKETIKERLNYLRSEYRLNKEYMIKNNTKSSISSQSQDHESTDHIQSIL